MNKKLIFHISLCVILFCVLSAVYVAFTPSSELPQALYESSINTSDKGEPVTRDGITYIGKEISLSSYPTLVHHGDDVKIEIHGEPNTLYDINVYYPSGLSSAKALSDIQSDENGIAAWEFKISSKTAAKKLRVVIRSENSYLSFYIPVEKAS